MCGRWTRSRVFSLKLPRCEASDVDVELVEPGIVTVAVELDLELQLLLLYGQLADRAEGTGARTSPRMIRSSGGELSTLARYSGFLAQGLFVHLADSHRKGAVATDEGARPDATGRRRARH